MNKKIILGIMIVGIIFGSVGVYAGSNFYANGISVNAPTGSNLGSDATLQNSLDELYSIADKYDELKKEINSMLDKMYPVGSIYISTDIKSASDVAKKFGGTWEAYGTGKTLVGVDTSNTNFNTVSKTGGSSTTTLTTSNIPSHNHSIPSLSGTAAATGSGYNIGYGSSTRSVSAWSGSHSHGLGGSNGHVLYNIVYGNGNYALLATTGGNGWWGNTPTNATTITVSGQTTSDYYANSISGVANHSHSVTTNSSTTGSTGSGTSFSVQNPYITVYMYKRIS